MKKFIEKGKVWECENLDLLSPITKEYTIALFTDGTVAEYNGEEEATTAEKKEYIHRDGYLLKGDTIKIVSGRKMKNEVKIINNFFDYIVPNTYGKNKTTYASFTDGTKVNIKHCRVIGFENIETVNGEFKGYKIGGRI